MSASAIIQGCVTGMVPLIIATLSGVILTYIKAFSKVSNNIISKSFPNYFFPVFCLFNLAKWVSIGTMSELWPMFVSPSIIIPISALIGVVFLPVIKPPKHLTFTTVSLIALPNMGNIPLLILKGLCSPYGYLGDDDYCIEVNGYVAILALTFNIYMWVGGYALIQLDSLAKESEQTNDELHTEEEISELDLVKDPVLMKTILIKSFLSPIPVASAIGLILGFVPGMKWLFFYEYSPLYSVSDSAFSIAYAGLLFSQMVLGSNIVLCKDELKGISKRYAAQIVLFRNIIIPFVSLWYTYLFWWLGIFGDNRVMAYTNFISAASPSAIGILLICQLLDVGIKEATLLMAIQYIVGFVTIPMFSYLFFFLF